MDIPLPFERYLRRAPRTVHIPSLKMAQAKLMLYECYEKKIAADLVDDRVRSVPLAPCFACWEMWSLTVRLSGLPEQCATRANAEVHVQLLHAKVRSPFTQPWLLVCPCAAAEVERRAGQAEKPAHALVLHGSRPSRKKRCWLHSPVDGRDAELVESACS